MKISTRFTSVACIKKALKRMGFAENAVREYETPRHLEGYHGDVRVQKADIIVPRRFVGGASNDIGFERMADGTFEVHCSQHDRDHANGRLPERSWPDSFKHAYEVEITKELLDEQGWEYSETEDPETRVVTIRASQW